MKKILNLLTSILLVIFIQQISFANVIDKTISQSEINKGAISVSIRDVSSGKVVYELNENQSNMPASTLKLVTLKAALDTLGYNYEFTTKLFKNTNNDLFLKLGADPFLSSSDLNYLIKTAMEKKINSPKNIYIDDYIFDNTEWGEGWQWDDDLNPLMPKFSSYNLDRNILSIIISPTRYNAPANIYTTKFYPTTFMNLVTTGDETDVSLTRNNNISPDIINANGTVKVQITKQIPINNPKRYFILQLEEAIKNEKMYYYGNFYQKKTPTTNTYLVAEIKHPIEDTLELILKNSDNFMAETVFKLAGKEFVQNTGSLKNSQRMINTYFDKLNLKHDDIKIVDGSGVSKNNIVTADFMTRFLVKIAEDKSYINSLPTAGEGTLTNRMLYFKDNIKAKTGTLSDVSCIAGYITSRSGKTYAFDIMINDPKSRPSTKKLLEEYILRDVYAKF